MERLILWLAGAFGVSIPKSTPLLIPDEPPVDQELYLQAWRDIMDHEQGLVICAHLRHLMWSEAGSKCVDGSTLEQVALWQKAHEGRMEILEMLVTEATHNISLGDHKPKSKWKSVARTREETNVI